jgi:Protein of unknown function (DUF433)
MGQEDCDDDRPNRDQPGGMGKPVIRRTRITVELLLRRLAEGASDADLLEDYLTHSFHSFPKMMPS